MWSKFSHGRDNFQKLILTQTPGGHTLADMVSMMVNKLVYKPSVKDIMDKYYEMFRSKNHSEANKKDFSNSPDQSDQDSHADG
jgi:hypothetical protein